MACLPGKNVIRSAKASWFARHGVEYGLFRKETLVGAVGIEPTTS